MALAGSGVAVFHPFWTPGSGYYGNTLGKVGRGIVDSNASFVLSFTDELAVRPGQVFTVADYGANDGYASMDLIAKVIDQVRVKAGANLQVQVVYEDQADNDFNSLFARLAGNDGLLSRYANVFPLATNVHFYRQCVPSATCDLIVTSQSVHWMEQRQTAFKDAIFHGSARAQQEELRHFRKRAEEDWVKFLLLRAKEVKPGGLLVVFSPATADTFQPASVQGENCAVPRGEGEASGAIERQGMFAVDAMADLEAAWVWIREQGVITQEEYERGGLPFYLRTPQEVLSPFSSPESPARRAGLSVLQHDLVFSPCTAQRLWRDKLRTEAVDDRSYFAGVVAGRNRVYSLSPLHSALSPQRSPQDKDHVMEQLYRHHQVITGTRDPACYRSAFITSRLVVKKLGNHSTDGRLP